MEHPESAWSRVASRAAALLLLAVSGAMYAAVQLWFAWRDQPLGFDESYIGGLALRLLNGHMLPGVDGIGQRGPMFYWLTTLAQGLGGPHRWLGLRLLTLLSAFGSMTALYALGALAKRPMAGAIAAALFVYLELHAYIIGAGAAANGEQLVLPLVAWACVSTAFAVRSSDPRRRARLSFVAGALIGVAGWTKITFLVAVAPLSLWAWVALAAPGTSLRSSARAVAPFALGWLSPSVFVLGVYGAAGAWSDLIYRFFTYNSAVHMGVYANASLLRTLHGWFGGAPERAVSTAWLLGVLALAGYLGFLAAARARGELRATLLRTDVVAVAFAQGALAFASGMAQMRFWNHHFAAAVPWVALVFGLGFDAFATRARPAVRVALHVAAVAACVVLLVRTVGRDAWQRELERRDGGHWKRWSEEPLCKVIQKYSRPDDSIFVWGFDGDLYVSCARMPASRYVYTTLVAGIVPPFWRDRRPERVARNAPRDTARDLEFAKPALILDLPGKLGGTSVHAIPELHAIIERDYCLLTKANGWSGRRATFYARKDRGLCPARSADAPRH